MFRWQEYADSESKIRLICGIFNLDASFTILYNMPPRLFATEMDVDMPGPTTAFFAASPVECHQMATEGRQCPTLTLAELCHRFLQDDWDPQVSDSMTNVSILNLFIIVLALLQLLWLSAYKPEKAHSTYQIEQALCRWKFVWDFQTSTSTVGQLEQYGFLKTAALEFWQLAQLLVRKKETRLDTIVTAGLALDGDINSYAHALLERINKEER